MKYGPMKYCKTTGSGCNWYPEEGEDCPLYTWFVEYRKQLKLQNLIENGGQLTLDVCGGVE